MPTYCKRCKDLHTDNEICPFHLNELKQNPQLLSEAANFASIAGQYHLVTSQTLDGVAQGINKLTGSNLSFEGTHQYMRDIQVFKQLNLDPYSRSGIFADAQSAKNYFDNGTKGQLGMLKNKLNGTGQEIDWLRWKQGKLSSLFEKSRLLGGNAKGVDGETVNRFTGEAISRTTVKAAEGNSGLGRNISDVLEALKKGTLKPNETVAGIDGTNDALHKALTKNIDKAFQNGDLDYANKLKQAQEHLKIQELNNTDGVKQSTKRLTDKISGGQAHTTVTLQEVSKKAAQGAVIGAAVGLTVSAITNYLKYKNGEITEQEAFREVGQDTLKGALVGGAMAAVTIFLPGGAIGFVAGMAIGIYVNKTVTNILDEVFGKGAFAEILHASGYVYGMSVSLEDSLKKIQKDEQVIQSNKRKVVAKANKIEQNFDEFDLLMKGKI
ncbi:MULTISPECIES: hypothetical protein [unclassified Bacillus (in: firmicutes)]|uniref:hypothetical protein n=1 Tax=unclassified Bacillus (in: firmicutes) TaxID=185979 RepID=UPI0008E96ADF|nr:MULTISPECIES: hypothetical protein [unclassified Bacillus (in: firmicutes)]SFB19913.1 hypothetical protein SAMN02799634_10846 [Bacillus sp. UNCCL13]SFQ90783.1 hypothetical protein SAMN04488577_3862 [Bacillus sp. cl95]